MSLGESVRRIRVEPKRRKWVIADEVLLVLVAFHRRALAAEAQLVLEDVALLLIKVLESPTRIPRLFKQSRLNDFVGIRAGQRQSGTESTLDF